MTLPVQLDEALDRIATGDRRIPGDPEHPAALRKGWEQVLIDTAAVADRIRQRVADAVCHCEFTPPPDANGRCKLCIGRIVE